ncbi:MAG: hypothetical protein ABSC56_00935 [Solirubrobacteraceae bacterium]|jgi:flagellar biosynthesis GTPase FlhF
MTPAQAPPEVAGRQGLTGAEERVRPRAGEDGQGAGGERRTYRGRDLSEILPRIRDELGPEAIVTYQREGLVGGVGGFFARRFIEVEAMAAPRLDLYDGEDADPLTDLDGVVAVAAHDDEEDQRSGDFSTALAAASDAAADAGPAQETELDPPTIEMPVVPTPTLGSARPVPPATYMRAPAFASVEPQAGTAEREPAMAQLQTRRFAPPAPAAVVRAAPATVSTEEMTPETIDAAEFLTARGVSRALAQELIAEACSHDLPFAGAGGMRDALHACISRRLPRHQGLPRSGALIAIVGGGGSGKTRCAAAIAASYSGASALKVEGVVLGAHGSRAELAELVRPAGVCVQTVQRGSHAALELALAREGALVVADTPAVSPADPAEIENLGLELAALAPEEVLVTVPATANPAAARQLLAAIGPMRPTGLIVTHADETDQLGIAVELSLEAGLPVVFVHDGLELPGALKPVDPNAIAERLLT